MPQVLQVTVPIEIPAGYALVEQSVLENLSTDALTGKAWTMAEVRSHLGNKSEQWIKDNTVWNPKYSREVQQMRDKKVISGGDGVPWRFQASVFGPWLDKHWQEFNW